MCPKIKEIKGNKTMKKININKKISECIKRLEAKKNKFRQLVKSNSSDKELSNIWHDILNEQQALNLWLEVKAIKIKKV